MVDYEGSKPQVGPLALSDLRCLSIEEFVKEELDDRRSTNAGISRDNYFKLSCYWDRQTDCRGRIDPGA